MKNEGVFVFEKFFFIDWGFFLFLLWKIINVYKSYVFKYLLLIYIY